MSHSSQTSSDSNVAPKTYGQTRRRLLVDMHIPDWDDAFLSEFDPHRAADEALATGADGVMVYFQSHVGLCYWPTKIGAQHKAFTGNDPMSPLVDKLKAGGVGVCAYYSTIFNNWAYIEHPGWRLKPAARGAMGPLPMARYGLCCPNNPDYREFVKKQATEIVSEYNIDTFFFDMMWWPAVCLCTHCQTRTKTELSAPIPEKLDWQDAHWCAFQAAREEWISEFASELRDLAQQIKLGTAVYHNFALGMSNWSRGVSFSSTKAHDFLGGDFYGGRAEQLVASRLMLNLSESRPTEFMTTVSSHLVRHEQLRSQTHLEMQVCAALACDSAFLMIAAVDPIGRTNTAITDRIRTIFDETARYEQYLGGKPIEDVAVYFSDTSKMNFADDGAPLDELACGAAPDYPHFNAVKGVCQKLSAAHIPFGVITRKQLERLSDYAVIALPNLLRMESSEIDAFRAYVKKGGRIYTSRLTSLTLTDGGRAPDFALADVFGCNFVKEDDGRIVYANPSTKEMKRTLAPERFLGHRASPRAMSGAVRLRPSSRAARLASLTLPYGHPHSGSVSDENWSSIHSDPPWRNEDEPTIVENTFGEGRAIYSAADIETGEDEAHAKTFLSLINSLLPHPPSFSAKAHPAVWMTAFDQPEHSRIIISLLNYQLEEPPPPFASIPFELAAPESVRFHRLTRLPEGQEVPFNIDPTSGRLCADAGALKLFSMLSAEYA